MNNMISAIVADGPERLRTAVAKQVKREHQQELDATTDYYQKANLLKKIARLIKQRLKHHGDSPQSLWLSGKF